MYRIELYGIGKKSGKEIDTIIGICYTTKLGNVKQTPTRELYEKGYVARNIMNFAEIRNCIIKSSGADLITSTVNSLIGKETVFAIKLNEVVPNQIRDGFVRFIRRFPTVVLIEMKEQCH